MSIFFIVVGGSAATHGAFGLGGGGSAVGQSQLAIGSGMVSALDSLNSKLPSLSESWLLFTKY